MEDIEAVIIGIEEVEDYTIGCEKVARLARMKEHALAVKSFLEKNQQVKKRKTSNRFDNCIYKWMQQNMVFLSETMSNLPTKSEVHIELKAEGWKKAMALIAHAIDRSKSIYFTEDAFTSGAFPPSGTCAVCISDNDDRFKGLEETRDRANRNRFLFLQSASNNERNEKLKELANLLMPKAMAKFK